MPFVGGTGGDDLLGEDVEGGVGQGELIEILLANGADDGGALDEFVASGGEEASLGMAPHQCPERPMRCRAMAMARGEPIWQTRSTWPISMPSSSEAVAMRMRHSPCLRRRSDSRRR